MGNADFGECSKSHKDEDSARPLKKAKYVWQVKGKYHLKASCQNRAPSPALKDDSESDSERYKSPADSRRGRCIDKFLARTETLFSEDELTRNIDSSISDEIPVTLVQPNPANQDFYLMKWHARQIARGYIDNTINSVLETWVSVPVLFDVEDFVDHCDNDGLVEDEGILMAIQAHGLQSNQPSLAGLKPQIPPEEAGIQSEPPASSLETEDHTSPVDILNAAILVAIEKKGLSSNPYE